MRSGSRLALAALLIALPAIEAYAHPHVFITSHAALDFEGDSLSQMAVEWTFDELFTQLIVVDYDGGKKGSFTDAEAVALKKGAFDNLRNFHYFLAFYIDGKALILPPIRDFKPTIRAGRLVYSFSLPLRLPIPAKPTELRITIYDDSYYVAFDKMSPKDIEIHSTGSVEAAVSIEKTKVKAEWPGQFMPDQIVFRMKRK